jgi:CheY-like chemotaxis protein
VRLLLPVTVPVVAVGVATVLKSTAYALPDDRARALAAGFQMHLARPVEPGRLVQIVAHLASGASRVVL